MNKKCFKCGRRKPLDQFYRHPQMADGRLNKCKACTRRDVQTWYRLVRTERAAYERLRFNQPHRKEAAARYGKLRKARFPGKARANRAVTNAVRDGRLIRPSTCSKCGGGGRIEGHHRDYRKPLDVTWLCFRCHRAEHGQVCIA